MARAIFSFGVLLLSAICWSPVHVHGAEAEVTEPLIYGMEDNEGVLGEPITMYEDDQVIEDSSSSKSSNILSVVDTSDVEEDMEPMIYDVNKTEQNSGVLGEPITLYEDEDTQEEFRDSSMSESPTDIEASEQDTTTLDSILGDPITVFSSEKQQSMELKDFSEGVLSPNGEDAYALSSKDIPTL